MHYQFFHSLKSIGLPFVNLVLPTPSGPTYVDYLLVRKLTVQLILSDFMRMNKRSDDYKRKSMELLLGDTYATQAGSIRYDFLLKDDNTA